MPIRFHCPDCNQLLSIAKRKAGSQIDCPRCGASQTVPEPSAVGSTDEDLRPDTMDDSSPSPAGEGPAMAAAEPDEPTPAALPVDSQPPPSRSPSSTEPLAAEDLVVYETVMPSDVELPTAAARQPSAAPSATANAPSTAAVMAPPRAEQPAERLLPDGMILYPRQTFYIQALLFVVVGVGAFAAGYFMGRGDAAYQRQLAAEEAAKQRVLIDGKLVYRSAPGRIEPDEGAVIIALPADRPPEKTLSIEAIRPQDPIPRDNHRSLRLIRELGGAYARADAEGNFGLVVPDQGRYHLLLVSRHAARPADRPVDEADLMEMQKYFHLAEKLVNRYKYRWTTEDVRLGGKPIELNFGRDAKE